VHPEMKSFSERNPLIIGAIGLALVVGVVLLALQYHKLPFVNSARSYRRTSLRPADCDPAPQFRF